MPILLISWLATMTAILIFYPLAVWGGCRWSDGRRVLGGGICSLSLLIIGTTLFDFVTRANLLRLFLGWLL